MRISSGMKGVYRTSSRGHLTNGGPIPWSYEVLKRASNVDSSYMTTGQNEIIIFNSNMDPSSDDWPI